MPFNGKEYLILGARRRLKKTSFKSNMVYQTWVGGNKLRRIYGLGTIGCVSKTYPLTSLKSYTRWKSLELGFLTGSSGVFQADWQGIRILKSSNHLIWGVIPSLAPLGIGYYLIWAGEATGLCFTNMDALLCFASPMPPVSAKASGYRLSHEFMSSPRREGQF